MLTATLTTISCLLHRLFHRPLHRMLSLSRLFPVFFLCAVPLAARAQVTINLDGASVWAGGDHLQLQNVGVTGLGSYDASFIWDASSSSFRLDPGSVAATGYGSVPACPGMRFVEGVETTSGTALVYLNAEFSIDTATNIVRINLMLDPSTGGNDASFPFRPSYLRLVQNGRVFTVNDISSTDNPHFVADEGWLPNLEPITHQTTQARARLVDFPVHFFLDRSFFVYYGSGTPTLPAASGNDAYYYCSSTY